MAGRGGAGRRSVPGRRQTLQTVPGAVARAWSTKQIALVMIGDSPSRRRSVGSSRRLARVAAQHVLGGAGAFAAHPSRAGKSFLYPQAAQRPALRAASWGFASAPQTFQHPRAPHRQRVVLPQTRGHQIKPRLSTGASTRCTATSTCARGATGAVLVPLPFDSAPDGDAAQPRHLRPSLAASSPPAPRQLVRMGRRFSAKWHAAHARALRLMPKPGCEGSALAASGHIAVRPRAAGQVSYGGGAAANASAGRPRGRNLAASCRSSEWGWAKATTLPRMRWAGPREV